MREVGANISAFFSSNLRETMSAIVVAMSQKPTTPFDAVNVVYLGQRGRVSLLQCSLVGWLARGSEAHLVRQPRGQRL